MVAFVVALCITVFSLNGTGMHASMSFCFALVAGMGLSPVLWRLYRRRATVDRRPRDRLLSWLRSYPWGYTIMRKFDHQVALWDAPIPMSILLYSSYHNTQAPVLTSRLAIASNSFLLVPRCVAEFIYLSSCSHRIALKWYLWYLHSTYTEL